LQLSLLKDNELFTCMLPEKTKGQYWITHINEAGFEEQLIGVEGVEGEWMLKSNRNAYVQGPDRRRVKELKLEAPSFCGIYLKKTQQTAWLYAEPVTEDRKTFRKFLLPVQGKLSIGRAEDCDIRFANKHVSSRHAELILSHGEMVIRDLDSANGTYVGGKRVREASLHPGDVVYLIGLKLIVGQGFLALNNPDGLVTCNPAVLMPFRKQAPEPVDDEEEEIDDVQVGASFFRSPRFKRDIKRTQIKVDPPPSKPNQERVPLLLTLGPSLTMGMSAGFMAVYSMQNALNSTGSIRNALPSLVMAVSMLTGSIVWPILMRKHETKKKKENEKKRQEKYSRYLQEMNEQIQQEARRQAEILHENHVTVDECISRIRVRKRNLWERMRTHNDFLKVRLGLGQLPLEADILFPEKRFTLDDDNLQEQLQQLADQPKVLERVPVTLSLSEDWISGIIGNRSSVIDMVKGMIWQLTALHSYDELKLVFIYDKMEQSTWEFVKWLPHVWSQEKNVRFVATNASEVKELTAYLEKEVARREAIDSEELRQDSGPYYVVFSMHKSLAAKAELFNMLYKSKKNVGFSVVHLYDELQHLPKECSMVVEFGGNVSKMYDKDDISGQHIAFEPDYFLKQDEHELAVILANTQLESAVSKFALPTMLTFLEMFGVGKIEHLNALTRWKENDPTRSLETPIGVDTRGELFKLDLHEKFHGPHGLIAGMTGSGKSEFIMTFILSLAVNYHPHEVAFILIDYKGGGMANAFTNLPHLAGTITNLDGAAVKRSLVSIQSELKRRQAIFSETSKRTGISNIDIYKYQKLYREGQVGEPLQHLFMISDEFAELKAQQPEFMQQLVSAARIGRSLGVHLILATQKPSGVVDDQIWSNSKFKICLKVQDKSDSMDVIKRPDAAELTVTGRYYVQVGYNELFDLGQSAWAGAPYEPSDRVEKTVDDSVTVIDNLGRVLKQAKLDKRKSAVAEAPKQIDAITKYLAEVAEEEGIRIKPLWLEPIPALIYLDELKAKYTVVRKPHVINPVIGEIDDPANQRQDVLTFSLTREGNAIIYGSAGNGKTTFLTTLVYSLISDHTPDELNLYLLDFGSETLRAFAKAPHVGDVVFAHESEKIHNLFKMLQQEINIRKKRFADHGGDYLSYLRSGQDPMPAILVAIHNYSGFAETYENKEEVISYLTREGVKYGIYFVLTASNTNAVRFRLLTNFKQLFVLQMNDPNDYTSVLGNIDGLQPSAYKGRGIVKTDKAYEFQIAHLFHDTERTFELVRQFSAEQAVRWKRAGARKIPVLPERVDADYLMDWIRQDDRRLVVPIGVDKNSLDLVEYPFDQGYIHLALSQHNDDPDFAHGLIEVFHEKKAATLHVIDPGQQLRYELPADCKYSSQTAELESHVELLFQMLLMRNNTYKDALDKGETPPVYDSVICVIYGITGLFELLPAPLAEKLKVLLEKGEAHYQVHFLLFEAASKLSSVSYESWFKKHVSPTDGIWIGNGIADQFQLKVSNMTNAMYQEIGPQFGYRLNKGKAGLLKLLTSRHSEPEAMEGG
jgi:S-DNA-T family DNA segregation ATPase FtsK/SpoIIIE